jgi:hypothetical protein
MAFKTKKLEKSEAVIASKQNAAEKRREKLQTIASKFKGGSEPETDPFAYQLSMMKALNWYNTNVELKDIRKYVNEFLINTDQKKLIPILNQADDFEVRSLGLVCRLKTRGQYLDDKHENYIVNRIQELVQVYDKPKTVESSIESIESKVSKVKIDRTKEQALSYSEVIDGAIDGFVQNKVPTDFDITGYLKSKEITSPVAKEIGSYYKTVLSELEQAQSDLEEYGYGSWKKTQFKKFVAFVQSIVDACTQQSVSAKVRKPRKKKAVSPVKLVSKMKYAKENVELNLKSVKPESIIDSTELWVYNVKYRKLAVYRAEKGGKLSVKGTTILGFDIKESSQVMLRKPEEFFKNTQLAKRALANGLKTIKTRPVTPNGRINEETILLGAF